jgi:hypothetical protein
MGVLALNTNTVPGLIDSPPIYKPHRPRYPLATAVLIGLHHEAYVIAAERGDVSVFMRWSVILAPTRLVLKEVLWRHKRYRQSWFE